MLLWLGPALIKIARLMRAMSVMASPRAPRLLFAVRVMPISSAGMNGVMWLSPARSSSLTPRACLALTLVLTRASMLTASCVGMSPSGV